MQGLRAQGLGIMTESNLLESPSAVFRFVPTVLQVELSRLVFRALVVTSRVESGHSPSVHSVSEGFDTRTGLSGLPCFTSAERPRITVFQRSRMAWAR